MKNWGIALLSLVVGVFVVIWGTSRRGAETNYEARVPVDRPSLPAEPDLERVRDEILTGVAIMEGRIADLERLAAKQDAVEEIVADAEPIEPAEEDASPEPDTLEPTAPLAEAAPLVLPVSTAPAPSLDFYEPLEPYGEWLPTEDYGNVWQPDIGIGGSAWAPYTEGEWAYTDVGWSFVSEEPWGWACYHYGRWTRFQEHGWCWVPGFDWAPAWVSWRVCDSHIGWAPLPPSAKWHAGTGIGHWVDARCDIGPANYCFVPINRFGRGLCSASIIDRRMNASFMLASSNVTDIRHRGNGHRHLCICVFGPELDRLHRQGGHRFEPLQVIADTGRRGVCNRVEADRGRVKMHIARPSELASAETHERLIAKGAIIARPDKGWAQVADRQQELKLRKYLVAEATQKVATVSALPKPKLESRPAKAQLNVAAKDQQDTAAAAQVQRRQSEFELAQRQKAEQAAIADAERQRVADVAAQHRAQQDQAIARAEEQRRLAIAQLENKRLGIRKAEAAEEQRRRLVAEQQQREQMEQQQRKEMERQQIARAEQQRADEQRRRAQAEAMADDQRRKEDAARRLAQQQQRAEEMRRQAIAQQRKMEERRQAAEQAQRQREMAERAAAERQRQQVAAAKRQADADRQARARAAAEQQRRMAQQQEQKRAAAAAADAARQRAAAAQQKRQVPPQRAVKGRR